MAYGEKICIECGNMFIPTSGRQKKCLNCKNKTVRKKCKVCGNYFKPIRNTKNFCSDECAKEFKEYTQNSVLEYPIENEAQRMKAPTAEYIKEVNYLLMDFGIHVDIPEFHTTAELDRWKHKVVYSNL